MNFNFDKASQSLDQLPFGKRFSAISSLLKGSISIAGKDHDIMKPWIRMIIYNLVMVCAFFYFLQGIWLPLPWFGLALLISFALFIYKYFYNNKQEVRMSWTVYETLIGHDPSYKTATQASKKVQPEIRHIAWLDIGMNLVEKTKWMGSGIIFFIMRIFLAGLEEVWDLANNYLIPSVVIDKLGIKESFIRMKRLKDSVPEALVGIFGIDFIGSVVSRTIWPIYIFLGITSIIVGFWLGPIYPSMSFPIQGVPDFLSRTNSAMMTLVPAGIALGIGKIISVLLEQTITAVKIIYFTVFYTAITHTQQIGEEMEEELMTYLKMKKVDEVEDLEKQTTHEKQDGVQPAPN